MKKLIFLAMLLSPLAWANPCYQEGMPLDQLTNCANQNDAVAQRTLGMKFHDGDGVDKNYQTAFDWYFKAANQGDAEAQTRLGIMYKEGSPVDFDEDAAFQWFSKAAEQGQPLAQQNVGLMYAQGVIFRKDYPKSYMWFTLSGTTESLKFRDQLIKKMTPEEITKGQQMANDWLTQHPKK